MSLSKLTVIIPTYERKEKIQKSLNYWSNKEVKIIVLDGSKQPLVEYTQLQNPRLSYQHLPVSLNERLRTVTSMINTEYCVLAGDDEYYTDSGLLKAIEYLEKNIDFVCCSGRAIAFKNINQHLFSWQIYKQSRNYSAVGNDPSKRMLDHMNPYYCSNIYAITRSKEWNKAMFIATGEHDFYASMELIFELVTAYLGKFAVLPELTWFRNFNVEQDKKVKTSTEIGLDPKKNFHNLIKSGKYIKTISNISLDAKVVLNLSDEEFITFKRSFTNSLFEYKKNIDGRGSTIKNILKYFLRNDIVSLIKVFQLKLKQKELVAVCKELELSGVNVDYDNVNEIIEFILKNDTKLL